MAMSLSAVVTTAAHAVPNQSGSTFWPGNLLTMDNADFENGVGDWAGSSNVSTPLTTDSTAFLHDSALKIVAAGTGTSIIKLSGTSGIQIGLPGAGTARTFRVGAYVKMPANSGHTTEFDLGCYDSSGNWIGWENGTAVSNNSSGDWQWVEDNISVPSDCDHVQGSPQVQFTGMNANGTIHMDEVWFAPHRAALMIGAYQTGDMTWKNANSTIGPLQSEKIFYTEGQDFPASWDSSSNTCYNIEQDYTDHSKWPACIIAFKDRETEGQFQSFLADMPTDQTVIFVFHQEPEGDSFPHDSSSCDQGTTSDSVEFTCEFAQEAGAIQTAVDPQHDNRTENVFTAEDSSSIKYATGGVGASCGWIAPSGADFYLVDHYERGWANGTNLHMQTGDTTGVAAQQWNNWLSCVTPYSTTEDRPIGLSEYGLCSGNPTGNICSGGVTDCSGGQSTSDDEATMEADRSYLANEPWGTSPTLLWEYWYDNCWSFDNTNGGITEWQTTIEGQNGGAVGG
jgi:hypothetical protein